MVAGNKARGLAQRGEILLWKCFLFGALLNKALLVQESPGTALTMWVQLYHSFSTEYRTKWGDKKNNKNLF